MAKKNGLEKDLNQLFGQYLDRDATVYVVDTRITDGRIRKYEGDLPAERILKGATRERDKDDFGQTFGFLDNHKLNTGQEKEDAISFARCWEDSPPVYEVSIRRVHY